MELEDKDANTLCMCRTCLQVLSEDALDTSKHDIFLTPDIVKKLVLCTSLTVEPQDGFPTHLCDGCYAKVNEFHQFQIMCVESAQRFRDSMQLPIPLAFHLETETKLEIITEHDTIESNKSREKTLQSTANTKSARSCRRSDRSARGKTLEATKTAQPIPPVAEVLLDANEDDARSNDFWDIELGEEEYDALSVTQRLGNEEEDAIKALPKSRKKNAKKSKPNTKAANDHSTDVSLTPNRYACTEPGCARHYKNKSTLNMHLRIYHKLGPDFKAHICETCGKVFKHSKILNVHRYTHKDPSELPFPCEHAPECSRRFARKDKLKTHMLRHAGVKNFVCPYCGMRKTTQNELKIHINYHTLERTWPCRFCAHVCNSAGNLKTHVRTMHERARDFACRYCERTFAKPDTRKYHEMTHTGEKPYACKECGKCFTQPSAMRTHEKSQHGRRRQELKKTLTLAPETSVAFSSSSSDPPVALNQVISQGS